MATTDYQKKVQALQKALNSGQITNAQYMSLVNLLRSNPNINISAYTKGISGYVSGGVGAGGTAGVTWSPTTTSTTSSSTPRPKPSSSIAPRTTHAQPTTVPATTTQPTQQTAYTPSSIQLPPVRTGSVPSAPTFPAPTVTPAPEYEKSPEQQAWEEMYSQQLKQWVEAGGYGIPEETQQQMIQSLTEQLKAKEAEDIRIMRLNMERRGLTNSGLVFANEQRIRANTTLALAQSVRDIQIQSALLKMASFERALASTAEFVSYLAAESAKAYQPKLATWQAQQEANLQQYAANVQARLAQYSAQIEMQKLAIAQAYEQQNILLAHQLAMERDATQHQYDKELVQLQIEAQENIAKYQGKGQVVGTIGGLALAAAI